MKDHDYHEYLRVCKIFGKHFPTDLTPDLSKLKELAQSTLYSLDELKLIFNYKDLS